MFIFWELLNKNNGKLVSIAVLVLTHIENYYNIIQKMQWVKALEVLKYSSCFTLEKTHTLWTVWFTLLLYA